MILLLLAAVGAVQLVHVDDPADPHFGSVVATGVDPGVDGIESMLRVYTASGPPERPAVLGTVERETGAVRFIPRFTFVTDLDYEAVFDLPAYCRQAGCRASKAVRLRFRMPEPPPAPRPRVTRVYPSAGAVPANLLRFYVHFSAPMRPVDVHRHVRLLDDHGRPVPEPFVEVRQGLWDPGYQRLTLFVHPGRTKRGVGPNLAQGPVLDAGRHYRLVIDGDLQDARGQRLGTDVNHRFRVTAAVRRRLRSDRWRVVAPASATAAVELVLPEAVDRALLERLPYVERADGQPVPGTVRVGDDERRWSFRPQRPWDQGTYRLRVPRALEDLAGNTVDRRFEEPPPSTASDGPPVAGPLAFPFSVDIEDVASK